MIVVLKDKSILTLKGEAAQVQWDREKGHVICHSDRNKWSPVAYFNCDEVIGVFLKDEDYLHSVGSELVRNMK
jgi:hypothetical protein